MIQELISRFEDKKSELREEWTKRHPETYKEIVESVVGILANEDTYGGLDPKRIHLIDDGDYQGTLLFVIAAKGYQPNSYWYVKVGYGSCSGCDALQGITEYSSELPTESQTNDYMTLALNVVQGITSMNDEFGAAE